MKRATIFRRAASAGGSVLAGCLAVFLALNGVAQAKPSFDCSSAKAPIETLICTDQDLGDLDGELARAYAAKRQSLSAEAAETLKQEQRRWLALRTEECGRGGEGNVTDHGDGVAISCLTRMYLHRINALEPFTSGTRANWISTKMALSDAGLPPLPWVFPTEQDKVTLAARMLRNAPSMEETVYRQPAEVCTGILEALRNNGQGITAVEPDLKADSPDDPRVAPWLGECPAGPVFDSFTMSGTSTFEEIWGRKPTYEENLEYGTRYTVSGEVRFYRFDEIVGRNKLSIIFGDQSCRPENQKACMGSDYVLFDFAECERIWGWPVPETYSRYYEEHEARASAIVAFRGQQFVMSIFGRGWGYRKGWLSFVDIAASATASDGPRVCNFDFAY